MEKPKTQEAKKLRLNEVGVHIISLCDSEVIALQIPVPPMGQRDIDTKIPGFPLLLLQTGAGRDPWEPVS